MQLKCSEWIYAQDEPIKPRLLTAIRNKFIFIGMVCVCFCSGESRAKRDATKECTRKTRKHDTNANRCAKAQVNCMLISNLYMLKIKARFAPRPFTIYNQHCTLYYIIMQWFFSSAHSFYASTKMRIQPVFNVFFFSLRVFVFFLLCFV